tara:strand:+ start:65 stop:1792 length:1728 start_codon:yes stop_codon:yes gene_type:complete
LNDNKNIENLLKDKLDQQEFDIQNNWMAEMSSMLDDYNEESKSKKGIFFILTGLVLLIGIIGTLFVLKNGNTVEITKLAETHKVQIENDSHSTNKKIAKKQKNNTQFNLEENEYSKENNDLESQVSNEIKLLKKSKKIIGNEIEKTKIKNQKKQRLSNKRTAIKKEDILVNKPIEKENISHHQKVLNKNTSHSEDLENTTKTSSLVLGENEKSYYPEEKDKVNNTKNLFRSNIVLSSKTEKQASIDISNKDKPIEANNYEYIAKSNIPKNTEDLTAENNFQDVENEILISKNKPATENLVLNDTINEEKELELLNDSLINKEEEIVEKKQKKDSGLSLVITSGVSFLFRDFESGNSKRFNEESDKISWNASLEIYKTLKNRLILGTGITLTNYGEKVNYSALETTVRDTITNVVENDYINVNLKRIQGIYSFDSTQFSRFDTTRTYKDSLYLNEDVSKENRPTNFMYIEIPVKIGYKIFDSKRFAINAMTGISFGFLLQNQGSYVNAENNLELAESQKVIFNYLLSADFIYKINKNINLTISPHFKYNLNNLSSLSATKRKYSSFGVNGGIIMDF